MEMYPRIGKNFDIRAFTNCRFGMMSWEVLAFTYCIKQIFAGAFLENYEPPSGFYFEVDDDSPVVQANITGTNHIMWTMGTDFEYQYAQTWFWNMDKLIHYVNQPEHVTALAGMAESTSTSSRGSPPTKFRQENDCDILLVHFGML
ncbi:putative alpha-mannosidase At5g13980 isoform X2 [Apium graveolens]|uniref:putative alpha-mannosidase At5g13980 isoform X2 n=1 Tax=Apium graveolens TaxID=4045 RepID=UPI003D7BBD6F